MKLKWQQAPVKTQWGDEMVVASVAIDKDHTVCLYCEHDQTSKVKAMFTQRKPLTETEIRTIRCDIAGTLDVQYVVFARAIEAAHGIREKNT